MSQLKATLLRVIPAPLLRVYREGRMARVARKELENLRGDAVLCPICRASFREFAPAGLKARRNARCPSCHSYERHRLLWRFLEDETDLLKGKSLRVLHFAPEPFLYQILESAAGIDYQPCDIDPERFHQRGQSQVAQADVTAIPFESESFDVVLCNHILEHVPDDHKAMTELFRVMKKGAWGIFLVPVHYFDFPEGHDPDETYEDFSIVDPKQREEAFGQFNHVRIYGEADYKKRMEAAGFVLEDIYYARQFSPEDRHRFGFLEQEIIYRASKAI